MFYCEIGKSRVTAA